MILPAVEREEDKATVADCPHDCDGKITPEKNVKYPKWACDVCSKRVSVLQMVILPVTVKNCPNCPSKIRAPDWVCDNCEWVGENE